MPQGGLPSQRSCWQCFLRSTGFPGIVRCVWLKVNHCRNLDGEVVLEEVEQLIFFLSCRVRDIQGSHWLGLLNAHSKWGGSPMGRDWMV